MSFSEQQLQSINDEIEVLLDEYQDIPVEHLLDRFSINPKAKNALNILTKQMLRSCGAVTLDSLAQRESLVFKTIKLDRYGQLKESMSFPVFQYRDIVKERWETSSLRALFYNKTYAFTVFKTIEKRLYFNKIVIWEMPISVLDSSVRLVWQNMYDHLSNGTIVKYIDDNGRYFSFFPASTDNPYVHVRPHAQNRDDTYPLPVQDKLTGLTRYPKHSFWLNRSYVLKIISKEENR